MSRSLYFVTCPDNRKFVFEQLSSVNKDILCIENCFISMYGRKNLSFRGLCWYKKAINPKTWAKRYNVRNPDTLAPYVISLAMFSQKGIIATPGGSFVIEKIWKDDPRYKTAALVKEYTKAFGAEITDKFFR